MSHKILGALLLIFSLSCFAGNTDPISTMNGNLYSPESLYVVPATNMGEEGSIELTENPEVLQINLPVSYLVSGCMTFQKHNAVAYQETRLPNQINSEQRAYEVRSYFAKKKPAMMAAATPFGLPAVNCNKKSEVIRYLPLKVKMEGRYITTAVSIPMENELAQYAILVDVKTKKVRVRKVNKNKSDLTQIYKELLALL